MRERAITDWNDIQFALAVAQSGSFLAAGEWLGVHPTTVSRRIQRLEEELGAKLLLRQAHGMQLTPAGSALVSKAAEMEDSAKVVRREISGYQSELTGTVRISVPEGIGRFWLTPVLIEFRHLYPEIAVEVMAEASVPPSAVQEVDVAITLARPRLPRLIATRVGYNHYNLFASRAYLRQAGSPQSVEELENHKLVDLMLYRGEAHLAWWNELVKSFNGAAFLSNSSTLFLAAIQDGLGIGMAPSFCKFVVPDLMTLEIEAECVGELWLSWHDSAKAVSRTRALIDFLQQQFARDRARWFS